MKDRGKPSEVIGSMGHSENLTSRSDSGLLDAIERLNAIIAAKDRHIVWVEEKWREAQAQAAYSSRHAASLKEMHQRQWDKRVAANDATRICVSALIRIAALEAASGVQEARRIAREALARYEVALDQEVLAEQGTRSGSGSSPAETAPAVPPTVPRSASACRSCGERPWMVDGLCGTCIDARMRVVDP